MTQVHAFLSPYDSGNHGLRMGRGPLRFADRLRAELGASVTIDTITLEQPFLAENAVAFALHRQLVGKVSADGFPVLFSGNCNTSLGPIAALDPAHLGIIWFDAHGEFNTPESTTSGFLDGMGLTILTGRSWRGMARTIPGFVPIPDARVVLIGGRDFDTAEADLLNQSDIKLIHADAITSANAAAVITPALDALHQQVERVYLHVDFDSLDPSVGHANQFAVAGGLTLDHMDAMLDAIAARFQIVGITFASYDPDYDPDGRIVDAGLHILRKVLALV